MAVFIGTSLEYTNHLKGRLPNELKNLKHKIDWPIDFNKIKCPVNLAGYYGEDNYAQPGLGLHKSLDIQVPEETEVIAPEDLIIIYYSKDMSPREGLANITSLGKDSRIIYQFSHLGNSLVPDKLKIKEFSFNSGIKIKRGALIGCVGKWPFEIKRDVPVDVFNYFRKSFNHLDVSTSYFSDLDKLINIDDNMDFFKDLHHYDKFFFDHKEVLLHNILNNRTVTFNPLLLFKKLCI